MSKVIAIESLKEGKLRYFGEGEYIGNKVQSEGMFGEMDIPNPCILLDNGKYVWGMECWWGDLDKFNEKYSDSIEERILVEPSNITPKI